MEKPRNPNKHWVSEVYFCLVTCLDINIVWHVRRSGRSQQDGSDGVPITSPRKGAFKVENAMKNVVKEFEKNGNDIVIIDKLKLIPEHVNELRNAIDEAGLTNKIIWWPE